MLDWLYYEGTTVACQTELPEDAPAMEPHLSRLIQAGDSWGISALVSGDRFVALTSQFPIRAVISMGRCNTKLGPPWH
jgi:hypothetical protein